MLEFTQPQGRIKLLQMLMMLNMMKMPKNMSRRRRDFASFLIKKQAKSKSNINPDRREADERCIEIRQFEHSGYGFIFP